ncbi:hypothetical protein FA95DRAFT_1612680 [Auriscalpium vulgare]|uniref:Uncharacterized protein n=1 Tax=Auriscalpium vulgare TaxID=40419 RepID=A0ACB8R596_9AGAM|nr:hypothetical protein FA95DRAFT_1612680 [Auriscalpium vulgare]
MGIALKEIHRLTGWVGSFTLGGPMPGEDGVLESLSIHTGMADRKSFKSEYAGFKDNVEKPFVEYLHQIFPQDGPDGRQSTRSSSAGAAVQSDSAATTTAATTPTMDAAAQANAEAASAAGAADTPAVSGSAPPAMNPSRTPTDEQRLANIGRLQATIDALGLRGAGSKLIAELGPKEKVPKKVSKAKDKSKGSKPSLRSAGKRLSVDDLDEATLAELDADPEANEDLDDIWETLPPL